MGSCREKLGYISQTNDANDPNAQYSVFLYLTVIKLVFVHCQRSLELVSAAVDGCIGFCLTGYSVFGK